MKRAAAILAIGAAAGLAAMALAGGADSPGGRFYAVERRDVRVRLVEFGEIESREVRSVAAPISGEVTWVAEEGTLVKAGDPVIKINTETIETALEEDRKANVGLEGDLATQKAVAAAIEKHRQAGVRRAKLDLDVARNALAEARSHPTPEERKLAELDLAAARLRVERAEREAESQGQLAAKGVVSEARAKAARLDLVRARADRIRVEASTRETLSGASPQRLRVLETAAKKAEMSLAQAEFSATSDVAAARESLAVARTRWQVQSERLSRTEKKIASATALAPVDGAVALIDVYKGGSSLSPVQVGENHPEGRELLKIADAGAPRVRVRVSEADVARVKVGQPASVRLRSAPGTALAARVSSIAVFAEDKNRKLGSLALDKSGEAGVNSVDVYLDLELPEGAPQPRLGSTAEVEIVVAEFPKALAVPLSALRWEKGPDGASRPAVMARRSGKLGRVPLTLAATTEDEAVVAAGLSEGDQVMLGEE